MTTVELAPTAQITALRELQQSEGWKLFRDHVTREIEDGYADMVAKALAVENREIAIDRLRQVTAIREAGRRWLQMPQQRIEALTAETGRADEVKTNVGRRPAGL